MPVAPANATPAGPPPGAVHVQFEGRPDGLVSMESHGAKNGECRMPCSLDLQPGEYTVRARGIADQIQVPSRDSTVAFKKPCVFCYVAGGIFASVGIPIIVGGGALAKHGHSRTVGEVLIVSGSVVAASGIALIVLGIVNGGSKVVVKDRDEAASDTPPSRFVASEDGVGVTF